MNSIKAIHHLSEEEQTRLRQAVRAALGVPFIAGIEGYVWEAVFHYVKYLPLPNPHIAKRKKLLFDAVDDLRNVGWSLKAVQKSPESTDFELVIQRADIIKKKHILGFPELTLRSSTQELGQAILTHWNNKIYDDMVTQNVSDPRVGILLKSTDHRRYSLLEQKLHIFSENELVWSWTNESETGLQARHISDNSIALRWYPNQKQLFETFTLSPECYRFEVDADPLKPDEFLDVILPYL